MSQASSLRGYQQAGKEFILSRANSFLMWEMGTGKTRTVLEALAVLKLLGEDLPAMVVSTKRIIATQRVWEREAEEIGSPLEVQKVHGSARHRQKALEQRADVYTITFDLLHTDEGQELMDRCETVVFDELTYMKGNTRRTKFYRKQAHTFNKRIGLSGTPAPNGLLDLFYQVQCLDLGERFGRNKTTFKHKYFYPLDYMGYKWAPKDEEAIFEMLNGLVDRVGNEGLPEIVPQEVHVQMPHRLAVQYAKLAEDMMLKLEHGDEIVAESAAVLQMKLRQVTAGFIYNEDGEAIWEHNYRVEAVRDLVEQIGKPVIVTYEYTAMKQALLASLDGAETLDADGVVDRWNAGEVPVLLMHPQSGGHGLNLQYGGCHVIWSQMTWAWDLWMQVNRRVARPGGADTCFAHVVIAPGTVEEHVYREVAKKGKQEFRLLDYVAS